MNLYGWDTGYATTIAEVNQTLADPKGVPAAFSNTAQGMTVQGTFGPWSIVPGGAGELLHLQTMIASGSISGGGAATADLSGIAVVLEINLLLLPSALPNAQDLKFNFKTVGTDTRPLAPEVLEVLDPNKKLSSLQSAVLCREVEQCCVDQAAVPASFSRTAEGITVQGTFGPWSILPGGAGELLHLQAMIASGSISGGGWATADLSGIAVVLEINLLLLSSALPSAQDLKFNFKTVGTDTTPSAPGVVKPLLVLDPNKKLSFLQSAVLGAGVAQSLVDQAAAIAYSFANIDLITQAGAPAWLTPVSCDYVYFQTQGGDGYLVILSATDGRDVSGLGRQVDPLMVAGAGNGFFAISQGLFLQNVIMPILPSVYAGTDASFFNFDPVACAINGTKAIGLPGKQAGAITYYPEITTLQITVSGSNVLAAVSGDCDLKMGMSMTFSVSTTSASSVDPVTGTLSLAQDPSPQESHDSHIPWYDYAMGAIPDIIIAIVIPIIADSVAGGMSAALKGMTFASAGAQNVHWAGMKKFTINGGELNGGFRIRGTVG